MGNNTDKSHSRYHCRVLMLPRNQQLTREATLETDDWPVSCHNFFDDIFLTLVTARRTCKIVGDDNCADASPSASVVIAATGQSNTQPANTPATEARVSLISS